MPLETLHPSYLAAMPLWKRARDFIAGELAVKGAGELYLPRLSGQTDAEYEGYKLRAQFLNATARTHQGMLGLVFLKDPEVELTDDLLPLDLDADLAGATLYDYIRLVVSETLAVGRCLTLVDWSDEFERPYLTLYRAEQIRNWKFARINGRWTLSLLVLAETAPADTDDPYSAEVVQRLRVLALDEEGLVVRVYEAQIVDRNREWVQISETRPQRAGKPLDFIPVVWHQTTDNVDEVPKPPLTDLISLNLRHYQLSADHNHGLHFVALPTPWVAGFKAGTELRIGCGVAWVSEDPNARAGFLEFSGTGLGAIRQELDRLESAMVLIGARMLEAPKREAETAEAIRLRMAGEAALLGGIAAGLSSSLTKVLALCRWWGSPAIELVTDVDDVAIELNTDYEVSRMSPAELQALVAAWIQRGISRETLFYNLKRGEIIPPNREFEEEIQLIEAELNGSPQGSQEEQTEGGET
jgi:hypothetical protein